MEAVSSLIDIQSGLSSVLKAKKKQYPCHVNRISQLDDPCLRRLYYMRTAWDKAAPIDDRLQGIFESGNLLEPVIERIVSGVGMASTPRWRIVGSQTPTNDALLKENQISGTIDGFLQIQGDSGWETMGVVDIKTMSPNIYNTVSNYDSLCKYSWTRKYRGQIMLYCLAHNLDTCFLLLVNKSNLYDMKLIDFPLDMAYCDELLAKAKKVNEAIEWEQPPQGINDPDECQDCRWFSHCCPDITSKGNLQIVNNDELTAILDRMEELKPLEKEYAELEKERDALLVKGQDIVCGRWMVNWKKLTVNYAAKEASVSEQWRKKIIKA